MAEVAAAAAARYMNTLDAINYFFISNNHLEQKDTLSTTSTAIDETANVSIFRLTFVYLRPFLYSFILNSILLCFLLHFFRIFSHFYANLQDFAYSYGLVRFCMCVCVCLCMCLFVFACVCSNREHRSYLVENKTMTFKILAFAIEWSHYENVTLWP